MHVVNNFSSWSALSEMHMAYEQTVWMPANLAQNLSALELENPLSADVASSKLGPYLIG